jgi:hypothetical protein
MEPTGPELTANPAAPAAAGGQTRRWFRPVLAPLLRERKLSVFISLGLAAQLSAGLFRLPGMPCPFLNTLGLPCPGCGGTRAAAALLRGNLAESAAMHLYAPVFLCAAVLFLLAAFLPTRLRDWFLNLVESTERKTGLTNLLLIILLLYWLARLAYDGRGFTRLVTG